MEGEAGRTLVATLIPVVAFLFVFWETRETPPLHTARVAFGALAILGMIGIFSLARIVSQEASATMMALQSMLPGALSIAAWFVVIRDRPGKNGLLFATIAAAAVVAITVLRFVGSALLVTMLAESGRQDGTAVPFVLAAVVVTMANTAIGLKAFRAVRRLSAALNDRPTD